MSADMDTVTTIGLDIAKSVFQVHGVDAQGQVAIRQLRCFIGVVGNRRGTVRRRRARASLRRQRGMLLYEIGHGVRLILNLIVYRAGDQPDLDMSESAGA